MIKKLILASLVSCALFSTACQPGDEAPPEQTLTFLGQDLPDLLGVGALNGTYWQGTAAIETCSYVPLTPETAAGCSLLQDAQNLVDSNITANTSLTVDRSAGLNATLTVFVPHFNLLPNGY